jgi:tetratricopeptide (TPR) repeat protein
MKPQINSWLGLLLLAGNPAGLPAQKAGEPEIERFSRQAEQALAAKDWDSARRALEELARLEPGVPEVHANLGLAYYSQGHIFEAARAFERALALNPRLTQAKLMLGLCDAELGLNREALTILDPAFRHPPDTQIGRLIGLGLERVYADLKEPDKAIAVSSELLRRYPDDPEILLQASRLHAGRSYELMRRLIRTAPDSVWVHYANAEVHESLEHYDLAIAEYRKILEMEPRLPGIHFRIGRTILLKSRDPKEMDEALNQFKEELGIAPQSADAEYEIGEICRQRGQFQPALERFSKAIEYHPEFEEAEIGLSRTLISLGKPQEAVAHLKEAIRLSPRNEVPHYLLSTAFRALGQGASAEKEMALFRELRGSPSQISTRLPTASSEVIPQSLGSEAPP